MIEDALLTEYFNLSKDRKNEIMDVVCDKLTVTFEKMKLDFGQEHAYHIFIHTFDNELEKALKEENYEYCEVIKIIKNHINNAVT